MLEFLDLTLEESLVLLKAIGIRGVHLLLVKLHGIHAITATGDMLGDTLYSSNHNHLILTIIWLGMICLRENSLESLR